MSDFEPRVVIVEKKKQGYIIAEIMAVLGGFAAFLIAFIIGIIGAISFGKKSEELGNLRVLTLVLPILNLIIGACAIGFMLLFFLAIFSGMQV